MTARCVVADCTVHGSHAPGCTDGTCRGCVPRPTESGHTVCGHHADRAREHLRDLPALHVALAERPAGGRGGRGGGGRVEPIGDEQVQARSAIRACVVTWCKILEDDAGVTLPDERHVEARARAAAAALTDPGAHLAALEAIGRGEPVIAALVEHVDRHLAWLLRNAEHADQLVHDMQALVAAARPMVQPRRAAVRVLCDCGERVAMDPDSTWVECRGCGDAGVVGWWIARHAPADTAPRRLVDLPEWLSLWHGLEVSARQLRSWADEGVITPVERPQVAAGSAGRPSRWFDPAAVALVASARLRGPVGRRAAAGR